MARIIGVVFVLIVLRQLGVMLAPPLLASPVLTNWQAQALAFVVLWWPIAALATLTPTFLRWRRG